MLSEARVPLGLRTSCKVKLFPVMLPWVYLHIYNPSWKVLHLKLSLWRSLKIKPSLEVFSKVNLTPKPPGNVKATPEGGFMIHLGVCFRAYRHTVVAWFCTNIRHVGTSKITWYSNYSGTSLRWPVSGTTTPPSPSNRAQNKLGTE